eukprot:jgi/Chrpa1/9715/Chrysochromulina_OHIO_Genome00015480-RA
MGCAASKHSLAEEMVQARMEETGETDEEVRAALKKDEVANAALESVMKESLEQLHAKASKLTAGSSAGAATCRFWMIKADFLRTFSGTNLPFFQELRAEHPSAFVKVTISYEEVVCGTHVEKILSISHRWMLPTQPDPDGEQLEAIKAFLVSSAGKRIELVWIDGGSMPQHQPTIGLIRSDEGTADFKTMLSQVNMLYLGTTVLILFDLSYLSRFWTQFEAWLSMQFATPSGLKSAVGSKNARYHIVCIQNAAAQAQLYTKALTDQWANKTPQQAFDILSKPDVTVTNESDKHSQLPKIKALNKIVQDAFQAVDAQLQQRVASSAEAAARAKAELAAFERENGVKAPADDPLRKAAEQMEREAAAARAAQESHALAIAHGVMPNEEARVALEKDERANATLESGMKESLEQRLLATLHRDNGYWLEVAIEVPPAVFDASARD